MGKYDLPDYYPRSQNEHLLMMLTMAPAPKDISMELLENCKATFEKLKSRDLTSEDLRDFLVTIHNSHVSGFVRELVNPEFVDTEQYMDIK